MAIEFLHGSETPSSADLADLTVGTTAETYIFAVAGTVYGVRFYAPATVLAGHTFTANLWEVTAEDGASNGNGAGTLLATKAVAGSSITAGAWNVINFDTPVPVVTGKQYRHGINNSAGRYVATSGYFTSAVTVGNVTGIQAGGTYGGKVLRNGVYFDNTLGATQYPNKFFGSPTYLIDTQFEVAGSGVQVVDTPGSAAAAGSTETVRAGLVVTDTSGSAGAGGSGETVVLGVAVSDTSGSAAGAGSAESVLAGQRVSDASGAAVAAGSPDVVVDGPAGVQVLDTSGSAAASGSPDTVVAEILYQQDQEVWPALQTILDCLTVEMAKVPKPPAHIHMRPGDFVSAGISTDGTDECCQGLAWVRVTSVVPSDSFPAPLGTPSNCSAAWLAVGIELGAIRCAPVSQDGKGKKLTSAAQWSASVREVMDDAAALRRTACCVRDSLEDDVIVGQWVPLPLEANCTGGTLTLTVQVRQCEC